MTQLRNFVFTLNNYTDEEIETLKNYKQQTYLIFGYEVGDSGTPHLQGYMELKSSVKLTTLKNLNNRMHIEKRYGSQQQAIDYCKKDGKFEEYGVPNAQGKRKDLDIMKEMIKEKKPDHEIVEELTSIQAVQCIDIVRAKMIKPRTEKPTVEWFWGDTGTGKTRKAVEIFEGDYDDIGYSNNFIIGYTGNDNVIWDDFRGDIPLNKLLKMLDRYKTIINIKGGSCNFAAKHIIITSCKRPEEIYSNCGENIQQLIRRIDNIQKFGPDAEVAGCRSH